MTCNFNFKESSYLLLEKEHKYLFISKFLLFPCVDILFPPHGIWETGKKKIIKKKIRHCYKL